MVTEGGLLAVVIVVSLVLMLLDVVIAESFTRQPREVRMQDLTTKGR